MNSKFLERITRDSLVPRGRPIKRGARVSAALSNDWVESGHHPEEVAENDPNLTVEDIEDAVAYVAEERG